MAGVLLPTGTNCNVIFRKSGDCRRISGRFPFPPPAQSRCGTEKNTLFAKRVRMRSIFIPQGYLMPYRDRAANVRGAPLIGGRARLLMEE